MLGSILTRLCLFSLLERERERESEGERWKEEGGVGGVEGRGSWATLVGVHARDLWGHGDLRFLPPLSRNTDR